MKFIQEVEKKIQEMRVADEAECPEPEFSDEEIEAARHAWIEAQSDIRRGK